MNISMKWFYRLGFLLLLFFVVFLFLKLQPIWLPICIIFGKALIPFGIAAFISYLLHPVVEKLHQRGFNRSLSIVLIYAVFFGGVAFAIYRATPVILRELEDLMESTPYLADQYTDIIQVIEQKTSNWPTQFKSRIQEAIVFMEGRMEVLLMKAIEYTVQLPDFILLFALVPLVAFYLLKDWFLIKKAAWNLTPQKVRRQGAAFMKDIEKSLGSYIRGQVIVCFIIGVVSTLLLWLLDVKYSLLLGIIIGVTNIIPYFGPIIGAIPAVLIAAATSTKQVIWVAVIVFGLQFAEGNILSPLIVGKSLHMHPLLIMLSLFIGGEIGGVVGLLVAVPILAILKVALTHARIHFKRQRQMVYKRD